MARGVEFVGNFVLPQKDSSQFVTVQTAGADDSDIANRRVGPDDAVRMAKLRSPNSRPALQTAPGAHHWRIQLLEFEANPGGAGDIMTLGDGSASQNTLALVPHDLVVDRCYIHGDVDAGQKRGIALNSATTTISNSYIAEMKAEGQDSQAIMAWNGPGPYTIQNNYVEAAGDNLLIGGADPAIRDLVPSDIVVTGNTLSRPISWRGQRWQIKNVLELKNARRVSIRGNVFENNWQAAQAGFAILFTVRNQDGGCPWCQVNAVVFEHNIVRHSAGGVSILGFDDTHPSQQTQTIAIKNNLFTDIDNEHWGGNGYFLLINGGPRDIDVDHNTVIQEHASGIAQIDGPPVLGFTFTNNVVRNNAYGIIGRDRAPGNDTINAFFPAASIVGNAIADAAPDKYPRGNQFPSTAELRSQFVDYDGGDYRLKPTSSWIRAGTDGAALGAGFTALPRDPGPVRTPPPRRPDGRRGHAR